MNLYLAWRNPSPPSEPKPPPRLPRIERSRELLYLGLLLGLAALSSWFLSTVESSLREPVQENDNLPPLYMDNFLATHMDKQGLRKYTLAAPQLIQLPDPLGTWMEHPSIEIYENGRVRQWLIQAEEGWIAPDNDTIKLKETVTMTRPASSGKRPVVITTRNVFIYPNDNIAETAEAAHMETPGGVVDAIGVKALLNQEQLQLLSEVRGTYEAAKP